MRPPRHVNRILIGIQARSYSKEFPNMGDVLIGERTMAEMILTSAEEAVSFMRRNLEAPLEFNIALLIPEGDPLKRYATHCAIVEGDELDVLSRFHKAFAFFRPDYVCRLYGNCPLLPDYVISKHVRSALYGHVDYVSNVDARCRTAPDGHDVEVMSKRLMRWLFDNARKPHHKEHVTLLLREDPPDWAKISAVVGYVDHSNVKLSVRTPADFERVKEMHKRINDKLSRAKTMRSGNVVFRL